MGGSRTIALIARRLRACTQLLTAGGAVRHDVINRPGGGSKQGLKKKDRPRSAKPRRSFDKTFKSTVRRFQRRTMRRQFVFLRRCNSTTALGRSQVPQGLCARGTARNQRWSSTRPRSPNLTPNARPNRCTRSGISTALALSGRPLRRRMALRVQCPPHHYSRHCCSPATRCPAL